MLTLAAERWAGLEDVRSIDLTSGPSRELADLGFSRAQQRTPGLLMPVRTVGGTVTLYAYRPDDPRTDSKGKAIKYELPKRARVRLDVPPRCTGKMGDPAVELWITEGAKKGDSLAQRGLCAVDLLGVWNFKGKNDMGGVTVLADLDEIALDERRVNIAFDSDAAANKQIRDALARLTLVLERRGARVTTHRLQDRPRSYGLFPLQGLPPIRENRLYRVWGSSRSFSHTFHGPKPCPVS